MKQLVPRLFRRRQINHRAATQAGAFPGAFPVRVPESDPRALPSNGRVSAVCPGQPAPCTIGIGTVDISSDDIFSDRDDAAVAVSTLNNGRPEADTIIPETLLRDADASFKTAHSYGDNPEAVGFDHISTRERIWQKDQLWLLEKQKESTAACPRPNRQSPGDSNYRGTDCDTDAYTTRLIKHSHSPNRLSSSHNYTDVNVAGMHKYEYSPKGVSEFECTNMYKHTQFDSIKKDQFRSVDSTTSDGTSQNADDDTRANLTSLLSDDDTYTVFEDDTCTKSSFLLDDDTRTCQSSSILVHGGYSESHSDEVKSESSTLDEGGTNAESENYDDTSSSYVFELVDRRHEQRRKYQLGVGQNATTTKLRKGRAKTTASASMGGASARRRRGTVHAPRGRHGKSSTGDSDASTCCPFLPEISEEVQGSYLDAKSALHQVLHAFFISSDDIDRVTGKIRDAKLELTEACHDQHERNCHGERYA